ncbi:type II toxin-antitoxin system VapC family toxin [Pannonibacter sp. SL95]|uniref:type II toxin-antitoxin system VapC family toxin n=1 Tax=Pannonibacter sp. SL95 TaxID=2995153 RepID=UPI002274E6EF|nr:PIN domain-containing protein [Pannonibacter sp. SL95]MCY1706511.1 PIN domain-containing protein [Pannonibacter sp. SL95]
MIVVDSSVWIDHFAGRSQEPAVQILRTIRAPRQILVGDIILLEVLRGARNERHAAALASVLESFSVTAMLSPNLTYIAARYYRDLRAKGITIRKFPDLVIAAFCLANDHRLLTRDRDFQPFAAHFGLRLM